MIRNLKAEAQANSIAAKMTAKAAIKRMVAPFVLTGAIAFLSGISSAHAEVTPAETFVQQSVDKGFAILKDSSLAPQERQNQFRVLLRSIIDFKRVAMFALGPYAHGASDQQINGFVSAFADYLMNMLQFNSDQSSAGPRISVTGSTERGTDDVLVSARVAGADGGSTAGVPALTFRVRKNAEGHDMIVDILLGGVSVAVTQHDELANYLQQHGGNIDQLSAELERRVAAK